MAGNHSSKLDFFASFHNIFLAGTLDTLDLLDRVTMVSGVTLAVADTLPHPHKLLKEREFEMWQDVFT